MRTGRNRPHEIVDQLDRSRDLAKGADMVRRLVAVLGFLFLACASSQMVETRGGSKYGPVNEVKGGRVKYMLGGADFVLEERREDAY
jgi:hypothetical protein